MNQRKTIKEEASSKFDNNGETMRMWDLTVTCNNCFYTKRSKFFELKNEIFFDNGKEIIRKGNCPICNEIITETKIYKK